MDSNDGIQIMTDKHSDFIERLFDAISNDPSMPAELKILLLRLQLPIHKLSQSEPHFITNSKHPARRTLFIAKRLSSFVKNKPSLIEKIDLILTALLKNSPTATNFGQTNQRLELLAQKLESDSHISSSRQNSTDQKLKQQLNTAIKTCLQGHKIPNNCQSLILKLWPNALLYLLKTHGYESQHWLNAIEMYRELLASIQDISNINEYHQLKDRFMIIARSNNNMLLLYHNENKVEPAIKSLISHYNYIIEDKKQTINYSGNDQKTVINRLTELPSNIKPGVWCEIYIDDVTPTRRLRLSLINTDTGTLIFVNRKGIKKLEKDALEFSEDLKRGLSKIYKHDTLFTSPSTKTEYQKLG